MSRLFKSDYIPDPNRGRPLRGAKIYVGVPNQDPTIPANQLQLTGDVGFPQGGVINLDQPVRTNSGGVTVYNNFPVLINNVGEPFAVAIYDNLDNLIYNFPNVDSELAFNNSAQEQIVGGSIYPEVGVLENGMTVPAGTTHLRALVNGKPSIVSMAPVASGFVSLLTETTVTIGGELVVLNQVTAKEFKYLLNSNGDNVIDGAVFLYDRVVIDSYHDGIESPTLFFKVVPGGTGANDGLKYIDLPASGLQLEQNLPSPLNVLCSGAKGDGLHDDQPHLKACINYVQNSGEKRVLFSPANRRYSLKTSESVPNYVTETSCLTVTDLTKVRFEFNGSILSDDVDSPKDCVLALAPTTSDQSAFPDFEGLWIEGNQTVRPTNVLKAAYGTNQIRYGSFRDMRLRYSEEDTLLMDGFVIDLHKVRCSFAGVNGSNFHLINSTSAANTGYNLQTCTGDYAGLHNFKLSGVNGHTYCSLVNCHGDFAGRDDSNTTIDANISNASAYRLEDVRVVNIVASGAEYCTRLLSTNNPRALTIDGLFALGMGHSDGVTEIANRMDFTGFFERVTISGIQFSNNSSPATNTSDVTNPSAFNQNSISVLDGCLSKSGFNFVGGTQSSALLPLVNTPEDNYVGHNRRGSGDALVTGEKLIGSVGDNWFNQSLYSAEQTLRLTTGVASDTFDLLNLTNPSADGLIDFDIEIRISRQDGITAHASAKYEASAARSSGGTDLIQFVATRSNPDIADPVLAWSGNTLQVTISDTFAVAHVKVIATGRPSAGTQTFEWM